MNHVAIGIDIGGTGIKGAVVSVGSGELLTTRHRVPTPSGGARHAIAGIVRDMVATLRRELADLVPASVEMPIGVTVPGVVKQGIMRTAANLDEQWIGTQTVELFSSAVGAPCAVVNDADAAGLAEAHFGAIRGLPGMTLVITFGTGIGSACINDGRLVPNFELGHLELDGHPDIERHCAARVMARDGVTLREWAQRAERYLTHLELLMHPDRFVLGGGISRDAAKYLPFPHVTVPVIPAHFRNNAGIVGAACLAHEQAR